MAMNKIVAYAIVILVGGALVGIFYAGDGAFDKLRKSVSKTKEMAPNVSDLYGDEKAKSIDVPAEQKDALQNFVATIENMVNGTGGPCFASYGNMPDLGEDKGTSLVFNYIDSADLTFIKVMGGAGGKQFVRDLSAQVEGMIPCVIAGSESVTEAFDESYLNTDSSKNVKSGHYNPVTSVTIKQDDGGYTGWSENRIDYGKGFKDFENAGYIYTPDNRHICFFPTVDGNAVCDGSNEDGLDDDCLGADVNEDISIPRQVREGKINSC